MCMYEYELSKAFIVKACDLAEEAGESARSFIFCTLHYRACHSPCSLQNAAQGPTWTCRNFFRQKCCYRLISSSKNWLAISDRAFWWKNGCITLAFSHHIWWRRTLYACDSKSIARIRIQNRHPCDPGQCVQHNRQVAVHCRWFAHCPWSQFNKIAGSRQVQLPFYDTFATLCELEKLFLNSNLYLLLSVQQDIFWLLGNEKVPQTFPLGVVNMYMCQFPFDLDRSTSLDDIRRLSGYDFILDFCIGFR